jgi:hypothetical protein
MFFASVESKGFAALECVSVASARVKAVCFAADARDSVSVHLKGVAEAD